MNVGQALGILQLRVLEIEERGGSKGDADLRAELAEARDEALRFGLQLTAAKREIESLHETVHALRMSAKAMREQPERPVRKAAVASSAEVALREENGALVARLRVTTADLDQAKRRIARLEASSQAVMDASGELSQAQEQIRRLESGARGYAMQIADLRRQRDEATALAGKRQQEIEDLLKQPAKVVEVAAQPAECPTCAPIIRAIAQAVCAQASNEPLSEPAPEPPKPSASLPPCKPRTRNQWTAEHGAVIGIAARIRAVLSEAGAPMTTAEIAAIAGVPGKKVATNIPHLCRKGEVCRIGEPVYGIGHRYWLKSRALPQTTETQSC